MKDVYILLLSLWLGLAPFSSSAQSAADIAADMAHAETGGRVLSVQPIPDPNQPGLYEVKVLLPDGTVQVRYYMVN